MATSGTGFQLGRNGGCLEASTGIDARRVIRAGLWTGHTSGAAPDFVQGNLVILPEAYATDFLHFCQQNPKPCPLLAVSEVGEPTLPLLGEDLDIRTDVPHYRVWRYGQLAEEVTDVKHLWRRDLVAFVLGCSFSFEQSLQNAGIPLRHVAQGRNVAMFRTDIQTVPAGPFRGPLVVSMRPMTAANALRAIQVTSRLPGVHGAPVHLGDPAQIGIRDLQAPDFGDPIEIVPGEIPVFWACGVTPQAAILEARPEFCITHAPGCMLVTDLRNGDLTHS